MLWKEKLFLNISHENKMLSILQDASKTIKGNDLLDLWNFMLDNIESTVMVRFHNNYSGCLHKIFNLS